MTPFVVNLLCLVFLGIPTIYGFSIVAPMRKPKVYCVLCIAVLLPYVLLGTAPVWLFAVCGSVVYVVLPLIFFQGAASWRICATSLGATAALLAQFFPNLVCYFITMIPSDSPYNPNSEASIIVVWLLTALLAGLGFPQVFAKVLAMFRPGIGTEPQVCGHTFACFLPFPVSMAVLQLVLTVVMYAVRDLRTWIYPTVLMVDFLGVAAIVYILFLLAKQDERDRKLASTFRKDKGRLAEAVEEYENVTDQIRCVAKLRHDISNQLATVVFLANKGERNVAQTQLDELRRSLGDQDGEFNNP